MPEALLSDFKDTIRNSHREREDLRQLMQSAEKRMQELEEKNQTNLRIKGELTDLHQQILGSMEQLKAKEYTINDIGSTLKNYSSRLTKMGQVLDRTDKKALELESLERRLSTILSKTMPESETFRNDLTLIRDMDHKILNLFASIKKLQEDQVEARKEQDSFRKSSGELRELNIEINSEISNLEVEREVYRQTKQKIDKLNSLSEHVNKKIKNLEKQRWVVERVNHMNGDLTIQFWEMKARMKELTEQHTLLEKSDQNLGRLEDNLLKIENSTKEIKRFEKLMVNSGDRIKSIQNVSEDLEKKLIHFSKNQEKVDNIYEKAREIYSMAKNSDALSNTVQKQIQTLEISFKDITRQEKYLDTLKGKIADTQQEWSTLDALKERISKSNDYMEELDNNMEKLSEDQAQLQKFQNKSEEYKIVMEEISRGISSITQQHQEIYRLEDQVKSVQSQLGGVTKKIGQVKNGRGWLKKYCIGN